MTGNGAGVLNAIYSNELASDVTPTAIQSWEILWRFHTSPANLHAASQPITCEVSATTATRRLHPQGTLLMADSWIFITVTGVSWTIKVSLDPHTVVCGEP